MAPTIRCQKFTKSKNTLFSFHLRLHYGLAIGRVSNSFYPDLTLLSTDFFNWQKFWRFVTKSPKQTHQIFLKVCHLSTKTMSTCFVCILRSVSSGALLKRPWRFLLFCYSIKTDFWWNISKIWTFHSNNSERRKKSAGNIASPGNSSSATSNQKQQQ